jgi:hypothetical protein
MKHGKILPGILTELGIAVNIQHSDVKVGNGKGALHIPRLGEKLVGNHQFLPENLVGQWGNTGKKPPVELLDEFKDPHNDRMAALIPDYGLCKGLKLGEGTDLLGNDPIIQKAEKLMLRDQFIVFTQIFHTTDYSILWIPIYRAKKDGAEKTAKFTGFKTLLFFCSKFQRLDVY